MPTRDAPRAAAGLSVGAARRSIDIISNRRARRVFSRKLEAAIDAGGLSACIVFGVDNLGELNRTYGFDAADSVVAEASARIRAVIQREVGDRAAARHLSGSKLGLVASGLDEAGATRLTRAAQDAVAAAPIRTAQGGVAATISAGVATLAATDAEDAASLRERAAEMTARALDALTHARQNGPGGLQTTRVAEESRMLTAERRRIAREAMTALEDGRIGVAYQPIVTSASRRIAFHECLARLTAANGSATPAGAFVPVIERLGQIRLLDRRILDAVFDALEDAPRARLSLNVSPQTLRDAEWLKLYHRRAGQAPRAAERLIVEITESSATGDPAAAAEFMAEVRMRGAAFALDDFGAGYTALRQLRDFRFDFLKIDGSFVGDIAANPDNRLFVTVMIEIAQHFDMATVAEFVETEAEARLLTELGVTYQQGYLHGAPSLERAAHAAPAADEAGALSA